MYAVIQAGGAQHRVEPGMTLELDRLPGAVGDTVTLADNVLLLSTEDGLQIGTPVVTGAAVDLEIVEHFRGRKLVVFKMKRRKNLRRKHGHRQELTRVTVKEIRNA